MWPELIAKILMCYLKGTSFFLVFRWWLQKLMWELLCAEFYYKVLIPWTACKSFWQDGPLGSFVSQERSWVLAFIWPLFYHDLIYHIILPHLKVYNNAFKFLDIRYHLQSIKVGGISKIIHHFHGKRSVVH